MKLLTLFEATKKGKYKADQVYNLYMPNGGEDGVLVGWRGDWPEQHYIEFRGKPYSQWTHEGDDFQRVHDRLAGMRATVLHHNSVVNVLPNMPEHGDIARAIDGGELPEWDKDRAFNEDVYHATSHDIDKFNPLSHFGTAKAASDLAANRAEHSDDDQGPLRTYRAKLDIKNPVYLHDYGQGHDTAWDIADGIMMWYRDRKWADRTFNMRALGNMMKRWKKPSQYWRRRGPKMRDEANREELISFLKAAGHDGIEYENDSEDAGSTSYINLDPVVAESAESIYDDGSVRASIEEWEGGVAISELSSYNSAEAGQAVKHLKQKYGHVTVSNIGERGTESYTFWMRALKRGLVDDAYLPNGERATPYSTQAGVTIKYNGQPKVGVMPQRSMNDSTVMMLPTAAMDDAFKRGGAGFYVGPDGSGASIGKRYETFQQWIDKYDQYELPEVSIRDNGILNFTNGRHRYAVFRDAGVDPMPVAMSNESVPNAKKLGGVIRESRIDEMADPAMIRAAAPKALAKLKQEMLKGFQYVLDDFSDETGTDDKDPRYKEKFAIWKEGYAQKRLGRTISNISKNAEYVDGLLVVYRMIGLGQDDDLIASITAQGLGLYWTWDRGAANAYHGKGGVEWLITGGVDPISVDWERSIFMNAHPEYEDESEITIPEGTPIKLLNLEKEGTPIDPSQYDRGRMLTASIGEDRNVDNEARLARAQAMGFDTSKVYYHGTMKDIMAFSKEGNELNFGGAQNALGHFFTNRPSYAARYAVPAWNGQEGGPNVMPVFLRGNYKAEDIEFIDEIETRYSEEFYGGQTEEWVVELRGELERAGYDGIIFDGGYEIAVFDEKNIRSVHAQFSDANSDQLLASIGESQLDDDFARGHGEGQIAGIKAGKEYVDSPQGREPEFDSFHNISKRGRITKANGYEKAYQFGYQDGYYTMLTGGDAEYLIGKITAKLAGNVS